MVALMDAVARLISTNEVSQFDVKRIMKKRAKTSGLHCSLRVV